MSEHDNTGLCPACGKDSGIVLGWDSLDKYGLVCPHCAAPLEVEYDESYDAETDEESGFFTLVRRS